MLKINPEKRNITPEKAVRILKRYGQQMSLAEARIMLNFMYNFAILSLNQVLKDERMKEL